MRRFQSFLLLAAVITVTSAIIGAQVRVDVRLVNVVATVTMSADGMFPT